MIERRPAKLPQRRQRGFTLLEVIVALTITAMVLGSLFALAAGSKQLAFRSGQSLNAATPTSRSPSTTSVFAFAPRSI